MRNNLFLGVAAVALIMPAAVSAQETTSSIRGSVTNNGAPVAGATVVATNVPSGTRSSTTTGPDGGFSLPGLRGGGPYTVDVTSDQGNTSVTDIFTVVQQDYDLPIELAGSTAGDIVITASKVRGAGVSSDGPQTVLTQADIRKVASVNRDIRDIERRDPLASLDLSNNRAVSFAGVNPRFNRFTINGVQVGDTFGLNPDASPTGRGPIPYDAIGQVSVSIAPYDFRQGGFQGGAIDTILLAGDNTFHGTGFYSQSTDGLQGSQIGSNNIVIPKYKSETYGATLRGPLIKDKLFFMVSAERNVDPRPLTPGAVNQVPNLTDAKLAAVTGPAQSLYGYNPGSVLSITNNKDEKIVGRIDWNITDRQKLSVSYINAYDQTTALQNSSTSTSSPSLGLESNAYTTTELLRAGIVQLNSDWTDNFSTEGRAIYRSTRRGQDPQLGRGFAQFRVCTDAITAGSNTACTAGSTANGTLGSPTISYGPDISRQTNTLFFDTWAGSVLSRLRMNNHELKILAEFSENSTTNNFLQYSAGGYYFDSLSAYNAKNADQLIVSGALNGQPDGAQAKFKYTQWTFGVQDDWKITSNLSLSYGVRYDLFGMRSTPASNPFFQARYGFPNTKTYKGLDNFQPRISFNYKPTDRLKFRGGFGVFGGGSPDIYLSNSFSNTILSNRVTFTRATNAAGCTISGVTAPTAAQAPLCAAALNNVDGKTVNSTVSSYVTSTNPASLAGSNTGALAQNFKLPSVYKATLSGDYSIFGINFGADYVFTRTRQGLVFTDIRSQQVGTLPDGRPRYNSVLGFSDVNYDILLTNTTKGRAHIGVIRFNKDFDWGLSIGGSYAIQDVKDVAAATSSTINSNYTNQAVSDPNFGAYGTSNDQTKWAFKYNIGYDHAFFGDYKTTFQLFGETRAGRPYSFTMLDNTGNRSPVFGTINTANTNRYLLYVPTSTTDPIVSYDSPTTQTALDNLINNSQLKDYRGKVSAKNIARSRAFTRIDLHLEQEIPTFIGKSRISVFGDIENLPNLLNHNWGGLRQVAFPYTATAVTVQCLSTAVATGTAPTTAQINTASTQQCVQYRYSAANSPNEASPSVSNSLYLIRVGARFTF
jgi:hypothetical protein